MVGRVLAALAIMFIGAWMVVPASAQNPQQRIAFVVGDGAYPAGPLANTLNDAGLVAESLRSVGFEVIEGADLAQADFVRSFRDFLARAEAVGPDAVVFVYFAGYGFAFEGDDFLVGADAKLEREGDIPLDTMRLSDLLRAIAGGPAGAKIVAVDAARRLPFAIARNGLPPGLAPVEALPGMLVGFSAAPGMTANDGPGPYGPYATAIAEMVRGAGLDLADAFVRIRARTHQITEGQQTPWHVSALAGPVVLVPAEAAPVSPAPAMPVMGRAPRPMRSVGAEEAYAIAIERDELPGYVEFVEAYPRNPYAARVWAIIRARREALAWMRAVEFNTPESYWTYLRRYPRGIYAADAGRRLRRLAVAYDPPAGFAPMEFAGVPMALVDEPVEIVDYYPPAPPPPVLLIEPRPAYFVALPPPPPRVYGVLPVIAPLPGIPRVAPGARIPVNPGGRIGGLPPGPGDSSRVPNTLISPPPPGGQPPGGRIGGTPPGAVGMPSPPAPPPGGIGSVTPATPSLGGPATGRPPAGGRIIPPPTVTTAPPPTPPVIPGPIGSTAPAVAPAGGAKPPTITTTPSVGGQPPAGARIGTTTPGAAVSPPAGQTLPQPRNRVGTAPPPTGSPPAGNATGQPGNQVITTPGTSTLGGRPVNPTGRPIGTTTTTVPSGQGSTSPSVGGTPPAVVRTPPPQVVNRPPPPPQPQPQIINRVPPPQPVPPPQIVNRPPQPAPQPQIINRPPPPPQIVNRPPPPPPPPPVVNRAPPPAASVGGAAPARGCPPGKSLQVVNGQPTCR